jgi:hypothetical protein
MVVNNLKFVGWPMLLEFAQLSQYLVDLIVNPQRLSSSCFVEISDALECDTTIVIRNPRQRSALLIL